MEFRFRSSYKKDLLLINYKEDLFKIIFEKIFNKKYLLIGLV